MAALPRGKFMKQQVTTGGGPANASPVPPAASRPAAAAFDAVPFIIVGTDLDDRLYGSAFGDSLFGGDGNDLLDAGQGDDLLDGGAGEDWASYATSGVGPVLVDLDAGIATGPGAGNDRLVSIEHVLGWEYNDTLIGDAGGNSLHGGGGGDTLWGGGGRDYLYGGQGNDVIGFDAADGGVLGGAGVDSLVGSAGGDLVALNHARFHHGGGQPGFEVFLLGDGDDVFLGASDPGDFTGVGAGLTVFGGSGNDSVSMRGSPGSAGTDDQLDGGAGDDHLWGGQGRDNLAGGAGDDQLYGGAGDDSLAGGDGFDVAYVGRGEGRDTIKDAEGLVLFWGNEPAGGFYDGVDPGEVSITYGATTVTITYRDGGGSVTFEKGRVETLNLFDFSSGDAGNGGAPPPLGQRDIWSASWDAETQRFTRFTLAVDG